MTEENNGDTNTDDWVDEIKALRDPEPLPGPSERSIEPDRGDSPADEPDTE